MGIKWRRYWQTGKWCHADAGNIWFKHCIQICTMYFGSTPTLQWHHNLISDQWHLEYSFKSLFLAKPTSKKIRKLRKFLTLCVENSLVTGEFLAQWASNAENAFMSWGGMVLAYNHRLPIPLIAKPGPWCRTRIMSRAYLSVFLNPMCLPTVANYKTIQHEEMQ